MTPASGKGMISMRALLGAIGLVVAAIAATSHAHGQKATERYIPLGQSPGVSQKMTSIGEIAAVDVPKRMVTLIDATGPRTMRITEQTRIWLDRTKLGQTNLTGSFADLKKGRRVEVKYHDRDRGQDAEWVKVEIATP